MKTANFVDQLYTKFLGRSADADGRTYWSSVLDSGATDATKVTLVFLNGDEFANVGMPIARLYYAAFGRIPDAAGLAFWMAQAKKGESIGAIASSFMRSTEFQTLYGKSTSDSALIDLLYKNVLGRAADAEGKAYWIARLGTDKVPRGDVLAAFANSAELIKAKNPEIKVVAEYQFFTGLTPSKTEIATALAQNDFAALTTKLYASTTYSGVAVPYFNQRGVAVDGYVQYAKLFIDRNNNHIQDPGELSLTTDIQGNYSFKDQESYNGVLITQGGTDIATGRENRLSYTAPAGSTVITPLTTILEKLAKNQGMLVEDAATLLATRLGLTVGTDVGNLDPIAQAIKADASAPVVANAIKAHEKAAIMNVDAKLIASVLLSLGISRSTQAASDAAFDALTRYMGGERANQEVDLTDVDSLYEILASAALLGSADAAALAKIVQMQVPFSQLLANLNRLLTNASDPDILTTLRKVAQIQYVADDLARSLDTDASDGDINPTLLLGSGTDLTAAVTAALPKIGTLIQDTIVPTLLSSTPADNSGGVLANSNIVLKFSENVFAGKGNITISDGTETRLISISDTKQVTFDADTVTINPTRDLINGSNYYVLMDSGTIIDRANNPYAGLTDKTALNFSVPNNSFKLSTLNGTNGARFDGTAPAGIVSVAAAGDVNGDGFADFIVGSSADTNTGSSFVIFGKATGFAASTKLSTVDGKFGMRWDGVAGDDFSGSSVGMAGDVNGDSVTDFIIGAPGADPSAKAYAGSSYVVFGKKGAFSGTNKLTSLDTKIGFRLDASTAGEWSGSAVGTVGDINGDGLDDFFIGATGTNNGAISGAGATYIMFGRTIGFLSPQSLSSLNGTTGFKISGLAANDNLGSSVASAGDINGDGLDDFLVSAMGNNGDSGSTWVVFGKTTGYSATLDLTTIDGSNGFRMNGLPGESLGRSVSRVGDLNGDGIADFVVGAFHSGSLSGNSYVVFGKTTPFDATLDLTALDGSNGFKIGGAAIGDLSGIAVSRAGDINGDGLEDLLIGAPSAQSRSGSSYIVYGKKTAFDATLNLANLTGSNGFRLDGANFDQAGASLAGVGDINGDGYDDIVIGSQFAQANAGSAYLFFGGNFTLSTTLAGTTKAETLTGTSGADTISAGAGDDTVLGNGGADVIYAGAGADTITIPDLSFQLIDGGGGSDTLKLSGADLTLDATTGLSHLRSIENFDITGSGNNSLTLTPQEVLHLSESSNTIFINGSTGDAVHLSGAWVADGTTSKGQTFHSGQAIVIVGLVVAVDII